MKNMIELERMNKLNGELESLYHNFFVARGLSDSGSKILYYTYLYGGRCSLGDLIHLTSISKQTISTSLHKMENEGLIRLENIDGTKRMIVLTDRGLSVSKKTVKKLIDLEQFVLNCFSPEEKSGFFSFYEKYIEILKCRMRGEMKDE